MLVKFNVFYNLESKSNKDNTKLLYFNMSYGYKVFNPKSNKYTYKSLRLSTQCSFLDKFWNKETKRINQEGVRILGSGINNRISEIEESAEFHLNQFCHEYKKKPSPQELKQLIFVDIDRAVKENKNVIIVDYLKSQIEKRTSLPVTSNEYWSPATKKQYENCKNQLELYQKLTNTILTFGELSEEIYWDIFKVLNNDYFKKNDVYLTTTTISKLSKQLKSLFNQAVNNDIKIGFNFNKRSIKVHSADSSYKTYLTPIQLKAIIDADISDNPNFVEARNYIIISSFTGLRIDDMIHLHELSIENDSIYSYFQTKIRKATNKGKTLEVVIPILQPLRELLKENNNQFPKFSSEQSVRKKIKSFLKHLNFNDEVDVLISYYLQPDSKPIKVPQCEVFKPHDCRGTFITNLLNLSIPESVIESITHPKFKSSSIVQVYNKSQLIEKMIVFVEELKRKDSELYRY